MLVYVTFEYAKIFFYLTRRPSNGKVVREGVEERYFVL